MLPSLPRLPRFPRRAAALLFAGALLLAAGASAATAADSEMREFNVSVDGKAAGNYYLALVRKDDGSTVATGQADVRARINLVYTYTYSIHVEEVWKDGRLVRLDSTTNDDGSGRGPQVAT